VRDLSDRRLSAIAVWATADASAVKILFGIWG